jgi:hypothetical protein
MAVEKKRLSGLSMGWLVLVVLMVWPAAGRAGTEIYDVDAWIDTTDYLYIHGSTLQWEHKTSGSPAGTHNGTEATIISSSLDGVTEMSDVSWVQTWPSPLPGDAFSSTFTSLDPAVPLSGLLSVSVSNISGRGTASIVQEPSAANGETTIVKFTDGFNGAAYLDAEITIVPEPVAVGLIGLGVVGLLRSVGRGGGRG